MKAAPTVLRGRDDALAALDRALPATAARGEGAVLLARGEDGAGRTALVHAARARAAAQGFRLGADARGGGHQPGSTVLSLLLSGPRPLVPAEQTTMLEELLPHRLRLSGLIAERLSSLSADEPLMLTVDDADRADPLSRHLLSELPARLADRPVLWLLTGRPGTFGPIGERPAIHLDLGPLTGEDLVALAADQLGGPVPQQLHLLLAGIAGSPRLASLLVSSWQRARAADEPEQQIPTGFIVAVRETVAGLPAAMADGLRLLATLDRPVAVDAMSTLAGVDRGTAAAWISRATRQGLLSTRGHEIVFRHELVRRTVYADLSEPLRRQLHRRCAVYLTAGGADLAAIVGHVRAAARRGDTDSADLLLRAAEDAAATLPGTAADLALEALSLLDESQPGWVTAGRRCVGLLIRAERGIDAVRIADELLARTDDADLAAHLEVQAARALLLAGQPQEALVRANERLARTSGAPLPHARFAASRALALTRLRPAAEAEAAVTAARSRLALLGDPEAVGTVLRARAEVARNAGHHGRSLRYFRRARQAHRTSGPAGEILALQLLDRYRDAETLLRAAWERAGHRPAEVLPSVHHARMWQDFNLGRLAEAQTDARTVLEVAGQVGDQKLTADATMVLAATALVRGEVDHARRLLDPLAGAGGPALIEGWLAAAGDSPAVARDLLAPALAGARESLAFWPWWPSWLRLFVRVGLATGDDRFTHDAVMLAHEGVARNPGVPSFEGLAQHLSGLAGNDPVVLGRAVETLAGSPRIMLRADAAYDLGLLLLDAGRATDGLARLEDAARIYQEAGATAALARTRRAMQPARPRRVGTPATGLDALTPAERRVARLISAGHTNRSAARELGVSPNTVNTQVTSIYAKLGVRSRVQLTNAVFRAEGPPA